MRGEKRGASVAREKSFSHNLVLSSAFLWRIVRTGGRQRPSCCVSLARLCTPVRAPRPKFRSSCPGPPCKPSFRNWRQIFCLPPLVSCCLAGARLARWRVQVVESTTNRTRGTTSFLLKQLRSPGAKGGYLPAHMASLLTRALLPLSSSILCTSLALLAQLRTQMQPALAPLATHPV